MMDLLEQKKSYPKSRRKIRTGHPIRSKMHKHLKRISIKAIYFSLDVESGEKFGQNSRNIGSAQEKWVKS